MSAPQVTIAPGDPVTPAEVAWQASFDKATEEAMAATLREFGGDDPGEDLGDVSDEELAAAEALVSGDLNPEFKAQDPDDEDEEDEPEAADEAPGKVDDGNHTAKMLKLLDTQRDVQRERDALKAEREAWEVEKTQTQQAQGDSITADALKRVLRTDPAKLFAALGINITEVSPLLVAAQMGDKATPEIRAQAEKARERAELLEVKDQLAARDRQDLARAEYNRVADGARSYVKKLGDSKDFPTVASVAKDDPDSVHEALMEEIVKDAKARHGKGDTNAKAIDPATALKRVEARWAKIRGSKNVDAAQKAPADGTPAISPKKLVKRAPLAQSDEQSRADEVAQAIREAMIYERKLRRGKTA